MTSRRRFLKRSSSAVGLAWFGYEGVQQFGLGHKDRIAGTGFVGDAPDVLDVFSRPAEHYEVVGDLVRCRLCPHACLLAEGDRGFCRVRAVRHGTLHTLAYGNLCALSIDPVEKKPLFHFLPQTPITSVAMGGCNLRCPNCQNWQISQSRPEDVMRHEVGPADLVSISKAKHAPSIAYTYTEPLVCFEYVRDAARLAREAGIKNVLVTAGYTNERPLRDLARYVDAVQLDLKSFDDASYRKINRAALHPILRNLVVLRDLGIWLEVSFLLVGRSPDEPDQVQGFAQWIVENLGREVPLHLLRFHPAHRLTHLPPTPIAILSEASNAAKAAGLNHVYLGNVPSMDGSITRCPHDGEPLIERRGYHVVRNRLKNGACPACGRRLAGVFEG